MEGDSFMALTGLGLPLGTILMSSTRQVTKDEEEVGRRIIFCILPSSVARKKTSSRSCLVATWSTTRWVHLADTEGGDVC